MNIHNDLLREVLAQENRRSNVMVFIEEFFMLIAMVILILIVMSLYEY